MAILLHAEQAEIYTIEDGTLCSGSEAGDKVLAVNGRRVFVANDMLYELMRTEDCSASFTVLRDGKKVELPAWDSTRGRTRTARPTSSLGFPVCRHQKDAGQRDKRGVEGSACSIMGASSSPR
ncbi:hypothetical protein ACKVMQ_13385 [Faecalibacterium hattorii]